ncbi:hypothetical protein V8F20_004089 [Naviculisporaceae sp. PSN 640]
MKFIQIATLISFSGLIAAAPQPMDLVHNQGLAEREAAPAPAPVTDDGAKLERRRCCSSGEYAACLFSGAMNPACRNVPDCRYTRSCLQACGGVAC